MNYQIFEMMRSEPFGALQWRNCLGRLGAYSDPIFGRMIVMPLENTIKCGDSMEGRDGQDDIFCKKAVSSVQNLACRIARSKTVWSVAMAELFQNTLYCRY